jgi:hypothetical protein
MARPVLVPLVVLSILVPALASAQGSIAGIVRDTSGAVLPGVTVEAASPALIEKVRTVVTDDTGQYQIVTLPPGGYTVTFTLAGFNTLRRDGVELTGNFTATVNADLRVGAVEETVTVVGEAPTVDVQNTARRWIVDREIIETIPAGRNIWALGVLSPGITTNVPQDVGGAVISATTGMSAHGGRNNDGWTSMAGITMNAMASQGWTTRLIYNMASLQEVTLDYSANTAEVPTGGVRINIIPREGGNSFNGTFFSSIATSGMQASNLTDALRTQGLRTPDSVKKLLEANPGFGGPLRRDKVWFYASALYTGSLLNVADMLFNRNAGNPNAWTFDADVSRPAFKGHALSGRGPARHVAGHPAQQDRHPRRRSERLHLRRRRVGDGRARSRHPRAVPDPAAATRRLDLTGHQPAAARGRRRPPLRPQCSRAVAAHQSADDRPRRAVGQPPVSRGRQLRQRAEPGAPPPVRGVVHHGLARLQGRRHAQPRVRGARHQRRRAAALLPLQQRHPESDHAARAADLHEGQR